MDSNNVMLFARRIKRKLKKIYYGSTFQKQKALQAMKANCTLNTPDNASGNALDRENTRIVVQIVGSLHFGDAVGNDVLAIQKALSEEGYCTGIFATSIDERVKSNLVFRLDQLPELKKDDVVIYHFGAADISYEIIRDLKCKRILRYHNVTPPKFFEGYDKASEISTTNGLKQIEAMKDFFDFGMVDSEFNKTDLIQMGHRYPIEVVPILIPFDDYKKSPSTHVIEKYKTDDYTNIVFVGRIVPNKKDDDLIKCFAAYQRTYNQKSRLILVGNYNGQEQYYDELKKLVEKEKVDDVIFTGHISFADILAYYQIADLFLCLSEHEGFCVPLIEAMFFEKPILAYNMAAVPETLGGGGMLIDDKQPEYVAQKMHEILESKELQEKYRTEAKNIIKSLQYDIIKADIMDIIQKI